MVVSKRIPMVPVSPTAARRIGVRWRGIGGRFVSRRSQLDVYLKQAGIDMNAAEYMGLAFFAALFYGFLSGVLVTAVEYNTRNTLFIGSSIGFVMLFMTFLFVANYPRLFVIRIAKATDREMLSMIRHMMIEVRSGVPLFNAMVGISKGYGQASVEFDTIVKDINAGTPQVDALNKAAERNTSLFFRRAVWQLANSMQAGSDIGDTLEALTDSFAKLQTVRIQRYSQELNPLTMMYMIIAVILPSLGITFLVVLSSFSGIKVPQTLFPLILVFLVLFHFFFMGFVKNKRPAITV